MSSISAARDRRKERHLGAIGQHNIRRRHDLIHGHAHRAASARPSAQGAPRATSSARSAASVAAPVVTRSLSWPTASRIEAK